MTIDRLSSTSALIAAMRESMARKAEQGSRTPATGNEPPATRPATGRPDVAVLRKQLVDLVRDTPIDDPESVRRLRPRVVRAILLWEFGPGLREHPEWQPMLETLVATLEADEAQRESFSALLADLKRGPKS